VLITNFSGLSLIPFNASLILFARGGVLIVHDHNPVISCAHPNISA